MQKKSDFKVWHYVLGFICIISLFISAIKNYDHYVERDLQGSTKSKVFKAIVQNLDSIGGPTFVYGFFGLIAMFFVYKIVLGILKNMKDNSEES